MDLVEVLRVTGHLEAAEQATKDALGLYEQKGATVLAKKARRALQLLIE